ncbi:MAG TPA: DUF1810 domain-containing protein [Acidobacteriaceae bacterium]|nr:DUF1810 domain-containing protein [Acidobacteriaceae bacterium]
MTGDPYNLDRYIEAQRGLFEQACSELRRGRKVGHWMWFVFPQIAGLGASAMSQRYAIQSLDEARAYLAHPVLGPRLREICGIVLGVQDRGVEEIFGYPDDMKFRSSMTLFARAAADDGMFVEVLRKYFGGMEDDTTLRILGLGKT